VATVGIKEARENLRSLIERVSAGEEIVLVRRGREVARLVPPEGSRRRLPSLESFRSSISVRGRRLSEEVVRARREERY
jgi:prevent-host-death family protein